MRDHFFKMGSMYDMVGLTYQGSLNSFWQDASDFKMDQTLHYKFINYLIQNSQVNGSFYKRLDCLTSLSGLNWLKPTNTKTSN